MINFIILGKEVIFFHFYEKQNFVWKVFDKKGLENNVSIRMVSYLTYYLHISFGKYLLILLVNYLIISLLHLEIISLLHLNFLISFRNYGLISFGGKRGDVRNFPYGIFPNVNFPRVFSQTANSQGYFPKWQLPKCAISKWLLRPLSMFYPERSVL